MAVGRVLGIGTAWILGRIIFLLNLSRIHPNALTVAGLAINGVAAWFFARGEFVWASGVVLCAALFDLADGPVARLSNRVTIFGGFLDSVIDRYSDLVLLTGLLVYYAAINSFSYVVLTAVVMIGSVLVSYTRARAESVVGECKVGFLERPERIVLLVIGGLAERMAPVLWVLAVFANCTVMHRIYYTWQKTRELDVVGAAIASRENEGQMSDSYGSKE